MVKIITMTSDEAHNSHLPLASKLIRIQNEADNGSLDTENQSFDDERICPQCGKDHGYKPAGLSSILIMISFLDRR
jgi:hypothetical protein